MSELDLAAIEERASKATPGPWEVSHWQEGGKSTHHTICRFETRIVNGVERGGYLKRQVAMTYIDAQGHQDFDFIAHARTDVDALVARVEELQRERDEAVATVERVRAAVTPYLRHTTYMGAAAAFVTPANVASAALAALEPEDVVVCRCGNDCDRSDARIDEGHRDSWVLVGGELYCCDCRDEVSADISPMERDE
jgi:hypothetical protein